MNTDVTAASTLEMRRPNETIAMIPKVGKISLGTRRLLHLLLCFAQEDGPREIYSRNISKVMEFVTGSKDSAWVKKCFREMAATVIEWNFKEEGTEVWAVSNLIGEGRIITSGGATIVTWELPRLIRERLMDPRFYTKFSLEIHSRLSTGASIALYEICSRYATNPSKVTNKEPWEWWQPRLTGNAKRNYPEYKYFSRETLRPAIAEVNEVSDLVITLIEHTSGRRVEQIQFKVERKIPDAPLEKPVPVDDDLLQSIMALGSSEKVARELYASHSHTLLADTVALTTKRQRDRSLPPLRSAAAFFKKALMGEYARVAPPALADKAGMQPAGEGTVPVSPLQRANENALVTAQVESAPSARLPAGGQGVATDPTQPTEAVRVRHAYTQWEKKSEQEKLALLHAFADRSTVLSYKKDVQRRGAACVSSHTTRTAFCQWYAAELDSLSVDSDPA